GVGVLAPDVRVPVRILVQQRRPHPHAERPRVVRVVLAREDPVDGERDVIRPGWNRQRQPTPAGQQRNPFPDRAARHLEVLRQVVELGEDPDLEKPRDVSGCERQPARLAHPAEGVEPVPLFIVEPVGKHDGRTGAQVQGQLAVDLGERQGRWGAVHRMVGSRANIAPRLPASSIRWTPDFRSGRTPLLPRTGEVLGALIGLLLATGAILLTIVVPTLSLLRAREARRIARSMADRLEALEAAVARLEDRPPPDAALPRPPA